MRNILVIKFAEFTETFGENSIDIEDIIMRIRNKCVLFSFSNSEKFKDEVSKPEIVARVKYETSDAFRLDESKRPKTDVPLQTFRKLNVD